MLAAAVLATPGAAQELICRPGASAQGADTAHRARTLGLRWIVLATGEQLEARGAPTILGPELRFRALSGTLVSAPLGMVDRAATERINSDVLAGRCVDRGLPAWEAAQIRRMDGVGALDEPARRAPPRAAAHADRPATRRHPPPRRPATPHLRTVPRRPR